MNKEWTDGVILLRPYRSSDVDLLFEAVRESIVHVSRWLPWCHSAYSLEESIEWIDHVIKAWKLGDEFNFVVSDAQSGDFLGGCGLNQINWSHRFANLGYWVRSSRTNRGIATKAVRLAATFGFRELQLARLEILAQVENHASQCVAGNAGALRECILRNRILINGKPEDAVLFSLVPGDLQK